MKRSFLAAAFAMFAIATALATGFNLGMPGAVKSKAKDLDTKVQQAQQGLISGTAASGRAIALQTFTIGDCSGNTKTGTTGADGSFSATITGLSLPIFLKVGTNPSYYSVAYAAGTANINPVTDLILRAYYRSSRGVASLDGLFNTNFSPLCGPPPPSALSAFTSLLMNSLSPVAARNSVSPITFNPFTASFPADGTGFDAVLDQTQIVANVDYSTITITDRTTAIIISTINPALNDVSTPASPANLASTNITSNTVTMQWTASVSTDVAGYGIYRNGVLITNVPTTTYTDANLAFGTQYSYTVDSFNWKNMRSSLTSTVLVQTLFPMTVSRAGPGTGTVTSAPAGINCGSTCSASYAANTQVTLTATPISGSSFASWGGGGCSGTGTCVVTMSAAQSVTATFTFTQPPTVPTNLAAAAASNSQINLSWTASTDIVGVANYKVYRNAGATPQATPTGTIYSDTGLTAATAYSYTVSACDAAGNCSAQSSAASTTTVSTARYSHTATLLPNGNVLVAGGTGNNSNSALASAEIYIPTAGRWSATGSMAHATTDSAATLLPNGNILVVEDYGTGTAEIYNPTAGTWSATGSPAMARYSHTATLLANGKVLVVRGTNGNSLASAEIYNPTAGTWSTTGSLATARRSHTATLLPNGNVLVVGGIGITNSGDILASAEIYNPTAGTWSTTGSLVAARYSHTATLLSNGNVLVTGGRGFSSALASAEIYNPATGTWSTTGYLATARELHTATLLPNGSVLVAGGDNNISNYGLASAEIYSPAAGTWYTTGSLATARYSHTATILPNGNILVAFFGPSRSRSRSKPFSVSDQAVHNLGVSVQGRRRT